MLLASLALLSLTGCDGGPPPDVEGARHAVRTAISLARPRAPLQARYLERLVADAEIATAAQIHAPWWLATPGRGQAAWLRASIAAREVANGLRAQEAAGRLRYQALLVTASSEIARARAEIREAGMGRREAAALQRATSAHSSAVVLAAHGSFSRAADSLETARSMAIVVHKEWSSVHARFGDRELLAQWREWALFTIEVSRHSVVPTVLIDKLRRRLTVYSNGRMLAAFNAELGANGLQRKVHSGDYATPEGVYWVQQMKDGRSTNFYKALLISYPNEDDRARFASAKRRGTIPRRAGIGGLIEIHGEGGEGRDWTEGCVALANPDMDWLYARAAIGMMVTIVGTHGQ